MNKYLILLPLLFQNVLCKPYAQILAEEPTNDNENTIIPSCDSKIYCQGELLDTIQQAQLFKDSKSFVDLSQKNSSDVTLANFENLMKQTNNTPTTRELQDFLEDNFQSENELDKWTPPDYTENPEFLEHINDEEAKGFAQALVKIWPNLGRKVIDDVRENPDRHSIFPIPNGFIIPGGRFKELYYWDSYWITKGLILSEMYDTVKGMLGNMVYLIEQFGFIPNGARVYYENRSQPPLFSSMVAQYINATNDTAWLGDNIKSLETELNFWLNNRTIVVEKNGNKYNLAHYDVRSNTPRPESYSEDVKTCSFYTEESKQRTCYRHLKSGAESGLDFSTRWFFSSGTNASCGNLTSIDTPRVIPVDLNSILCKAFRDLSEFYGLLGDKENQATWLEKSKTLEKSIEEVFYHKEDGIWYDYDKDEQKNRKFFYATNFAPLWTEAYDEKKKDEYGANAAKYFHDHNIDNFQGGIPTSLDNSGEQWDLPNAWPPHQDFVVSGLLNTGNPEAQKISKEVARKWISSNIQAFNSTGVMFEKYDAITPGQYGGGGEYTVQSGFGWSNGLAMDFIHKFYSNK